MEMMVVSVCLFLLGLVDCQSFLEQNTFWCSFLQLVDDEESYVRANAVSLLKELVLTPVLICVLYSDQNTRLVSMSFQLGACGVKR